MATYNGDGDDNTINGGLGDDDIFGKAGKDFLYGGFGHDFISGGVGDDFLFGDDGDDILVGNKGSDTMMGGLGADQFKGGKGKDTVDYSDATSGVTVWIPTNFGGGYAAGDTYTKVENIIGGAFGDSLWVGQAGTAFGGGGDDYLYGNAGTGTDGGVLRGDAGYDHLYMGAGNMRAWVQNGVGWDTIHDFTENSDMLKIDLSDFGLGNSLDGNELVNSNTVTAVGGNAQFIYEGDSGILWFDSNGTGGGGLTAVAVFSSSTILGGNLDVADFETML